MTNNNPLTYILSKAKFDATSHRLISALANYNFTVSYRPGKFNTDTDALSRKLYLFSDTVKAICNSAILDIPDADTLPLSFPYDEVTGISDIDWRREQKENKAIARVMEILEQREESRNESIMV